MRDSSSEPPRFRANTLIFDTGPLWELILYGAIEKLRFHGLRAQLGFRGLDVSNVLEFVARYPKRTTTPHVVSEIGQKIRKTKQHGQSDLWMHVCREFELMGMDEHAIRLLDMSRENISKLGAADAGIIGTALTLRGTGVFVLSVDHQLIDECKRAEIDAGDLWYASAAGLI